MINNLCQDYSASASYHAGDYFMYNGLLMMAIAEYAAQQQTNFVHTSIRDQLQAQQMCVLNSIQDQTNAYPYYQPNVCCCSGPTKTNCCNCGASLRGRYRCEYCGTVNN